MIRTKICGITRPEDAQAAQAAGADFMGLVFAPSPRRVDEARAREIIRGVPGFKNWVAVFVNEDRNKIVDIARNLKISYIQLHGHESPEICEVLAKEGLQVIKAHRVQDAGSLAAISHYQTPFLLLDSFSREREGGTGLTFEWALLKGRTFGAKVFLSGGLRPELLPAAFSHFLPFAVDVSSAVESSPGVKSTEKIHAFIEAAQKAEAKFTEERKNA